jgi:hypothetical protein
MAWCTATHWLTGIVTQVGLRLLIRYEPATFNVMDEAQGFDIFLESTGNVMSIAPEAGPNKFVGDTPQHGMSFGQLPFRFIGGAKRKNAVVVGRLVQNPLKEEDDFLGGRGHVSVYLDPTGNKKDMHVYVKVYLYKAFSPIIVLIQVLAE